MKLNLPQVPFYARCGYSICPAILHSTTATSVFPVPDIPEAASVIPVMPSPSLPVTEPLASSASPPPPPPMPKSTAQILEAEQVYMCKMI